MTGQPIATSNVLLLRFVDFNFMTLPLAATFARNLDRASDAEVREAYLLLVKQTRGIFTSPWVTDLATKIMARLGLKYQILRTYLTTGETSERQD